MHPSHNLLIAMIRRHIARAYLVFFAVFSCVVCVSPAYAASSQKQEPVNITFWELSCGEDLMQSLIAKFEEENPGIHVKVQQLSWDYGLDKIITAISAGNAPDVCELGTDWVPQFSSSNVLADITDQVGDIKDSHFLWEAATYKDKIYGVPWLAGTRIMFYNKDLFERAGLDPQRPPRTWGELLEYSKKITALGDDIKGFGIFVAEPYSPWQEFLPFAWGNGGSVLNKDWTKATLDSPQVLEAMQFYDRIKAYSLIDRQSQVNSLFAEGKVGIQISGSWNFALIPGMNPTLNFGVSTLPKPSYEKGAPSGFAGGEVIVVMRSSKYKDAALTFAKFLVRPEIAMEIVKVQKNIVPTAKEAIQNPYYRKYPEQSIVFEQVKNAGSPPAHPRWVEIQEHITHAIEEVILNDVPPQQALAAASEKIDKILKKEKKRIIFSDSIVTFIMLAVLGVLFVGWYMSKRLRGKKISNVFSRDHASSYLFISPWLVTFIVFGIYPLLYSIIITFSKYNLLTSQLSFIGINNFIEIFQDGAFRQALFNTMIFTFGTIPFTMGLAIFAAVLINRKIPFKGLYQAGFFLPAATSIIVLATIFTYIYAPDGILNLVLKRIGITPPEPTWLLNTKLALPSIMIMAVWSSFGYYMILFLAGLQSIPQSLYEAASIDGANEWQQFLKITLPQLRPILLLGIVINTINSLQVFPEIFTMTKGGPLGSTTTVVYYLYDTGFHKFDLGMASAVGYILFFIILLFSLAQMKILKMGEETSAD